MGCLTSLQCGALRRIMGFVAPGGKKPWEYCAWGRACQPRPVGKRPLTVDVGYGAGIAVCGEFRSTGRGRRTGEEIHASGICLFNSGRRAGVRRRRASRTRVLERGSEARLIAQSGTLEQMAEDKMG